MNRAMTSQIQNIASTLISIVLMCALSACAGLEKSKSDVNLSQTSTTLPAKFDGINSAESNVAALATQPWWDSFNDTDLSSIVRITMAQNLTWQAARTRVAQAQAILAMTSANQAPQINLGAGVIRQRRSLEIINAPNSISATNAPRITSLYSADAQLTWQWDLFDELKLAEVAASERVVQSQVAAIATRLLLASQAASAVIEIRALRLRISALESVLAINTAQLDIAYAKKRAGLTASVPILEAEAAIAASRQAIAQRQIEKVAAMSALALLMASTPAQVAEWLGSIIQMPSVSGAVDVGVPSQLLLRRPDLLEAEARLRAISADLASSVAQQYPRFKFSAQLGWAAASAAALGSPAALLAALNPSVAWPLTDGGAQRARSAELSAQQQEASLLYRQAVLRAFVQAQSAIDTLTLRRTDNEAAKINLEALIEAADIAQIQFRSGLVDQVLALEAERLVQSARLAQVITQQQTLNALIDLVQAVGGGWDTNGGAISQTYTTLESLQ
jgi:NodT family efflux transporter outer membrane factor (OMF) lipoprotein